MCGRFTQAYTWSELLALYRLTIPPLNIEPRYNIAPTSTINVVIPREVGLDLVRMRWGLIPSWWNKTGKEIPSTFNAHAQTVAEKPMFRIAFKRSRCVIPATGYFEWGLTKSGKQPYYITGANGSVLSIAGLWDRWKDKETGETVLSCTMIVTDANAFTRAIHDRMPVLLDPRHVAAWLSGDAGGELLKPTADDALRMWPVSKRVNKPGGGDDPALIKEIAISAA